MFARRGRGRGGFSGARQPRGTFLDGIWQCECSPRLPAQRFQVKKQNENHGKWFYCCQKGKGNGDCGFFLWEEEAKPREASAVLNNSRSEPGRSEPTSSSRMTTIRAGPSPARAGLRSVRREVSPPPPYTPQANNNAVPNAAQDNADAGSETDDEPFEWPSTAQEQDELFRVADAAQTPRKAIKTNALATPGKRRASEMDDSTPIGLPTPSTSNTSRTINHTPASTPTPIRFTDAPSDIGGPAKSAQDEVFALLKSNGVNLSRTVGESLQGILSRHDRKYQGVINGREVSWRKIKAQDAKIQEQQFRINTLEAELDTERAVVRHMKWERENEVS